MVKDCPHPRPLRRRDGDRHRVLQAPRRGVPRPRHPRPQRREAAQPRQQHGQARPRLGADRRPDQPLQHDVRPVLHGREPGRLRPRADLGRHQDRCSTTPSPSSRAGRCRCSSRAASRRCRRTSSTRSATRARSATTACRRRPTASSSPRAPSSPRRRPKPACATPTCSSTASATPPTRTAASATCSTSSCARSRTCTAPASTSSRSSRSSTASTTSRSAAIIEFALDNPKTINFLSFQPVSFTGRDEEVTPERRAAQRYTLSHLAHDVKNQTGIGEPIRDWFPISFMGTLHRLGRRRPRAGQRVGPADLRLPPELRHRHGA